MFFGNTPFTDKDDSVINTYSNILGHYTKEYLTFPSDREPSKDFKDLVKSLLVLSRLGL